MALGDPVSGGAAKIAEEMAKEVQTAMQEASRMAENQKPQDVQFQDVLNTQKVGDVERVGGVQDSAMDRLREAINAQRNQVPPALAAGQTNNSQPAMTGIHRMMEDVMSGQNKLEEIINLAISGRNFSQPELLALQAGVYRFTQELELTSKVIEKGTSSIKQTLNTQV